MKGKTDTPTTSPTTPARSSVDNRSRQLNPQHGSYWRSRGGDGRPTGNQAGGKGGKGKK